MKPKLYVILGSHACRAGMLMLEHKGIDYEQVELPTGLHPFVLRLRGFAGNPAPFRELDGGRNPMLGIADRAGTVPTLEMDGQRVKTNRQIARFLERVQPEPPLFPADPEQRRAVEEAERWGDEVFQMVARRMALAMSRHGAGSMVAGGDDGRLGPLLWRNRTVRSAGTKMLALFIFGAGAQAEARLRDELPALLDRIDGWIEAGVLNGDELNAADFMIAPSLALLDYCRDLRPQLAGRPLTGLLDRVLPLPAGMATA